MVKKWFSLLGCPRCGGRKDPSCNSYGVYKVKYNGTDKLKLKCRSCGYIVYFEVKAKKYQNDNFTKLKEQVVVQTKLNEAN